MKKAIVAMLGYACPFVFVAMFIDYSRWPPMVGFALMLVVTPILAVIISKAWGVKAVILGNILTFVVSYYFVGSMEDVDRWGSYFKPLTPVQMLVFVSVCLVLFQLVVVKIKLRKDSFMNKKRIYFTLIVLLAFMMNLVPALMYPDIKMTMFHFIISVAALFSIALLTAKQRKIVFVGGALAGLLIFVINLTFLSDARLNFAVLDILLSIEYPLYLLIVTPLFGLNYVFSLDYDMFALLVTAVFTMLFLIGKMFIRDAT